MRQGSANSTPETDNENRPNVLKKIEGHIQSKTMAGLLDLVPLLVTLLVVIFLVENADALVRPLPFVAGQAWDFPGIGVVVCIILFYLFGAIISTRHGMKLAEGKNWLLNHIPVIKNIFGVTQQVMTSFTSQYTFSRVVFLEWPREGMIAMGFVTGRAYSERTKDSMAIVYIPTIPQSHFRKPRAGDGGRSD